MDERYACMRLFAPSVSFVFDPNVNLSHASFVFVRYRESLYTSLPLIHPTHEKLDPYRFAASSPQMTSSRLIRGLYYSHFQCQIGLTNMYPSCILYFQIHNINLVETTLPLIPQIPRERMLSAWISLLVITFPLPYITNFDIKINHQRIQTTRSHTSHCRHCNYFHYYNVDFMLLHNVKWYIDSPVSHIHVSTT